MNVGEQAVMTPADWATDGSKIDWRNRIGVRTRQLWPTFSNDLKVALAEDADDLLLSGQS
jgi:hypothetical protein